MAQFDVPTRAVEDGRRRQRGPMLVGKGLLPGCPRPFISPVFMYRWTRTTAVYIPES